MAATIQRIFEAADYDAEISRAVAELNAGNVVVLPTETVYGAAAILTDADALQKLRAIRGNTDNKPFTIHLAHRDQARRYLPDVNAFAQRLMRKLWPGPVGLVFEVPEPRRKEVAKELRISEREVYEGGALTIRCPDHIVATDVLARIERPVVLTLAGSSPQASCEAIAGELEGKVQLILDAGPTRYSKPSTILKVKPESFEILRAGVYDERIVERLLRTTMLFVCSGNTCRSPMAEALARRALAKKLNISEDELEKRGIAVISAGSFAIPGARATPQAVEALKTMGVDLSRHRSRPLTVELIHQADVIWPMSRAHAAAVAALVPSAVEKTVTLDPNGDIEDPIGGDLSLYLELAGQMQALVEKRLDEKVVQLLQEPLMKIAIASDHRGFEAKRRLLPVLKNNGHQVTDFGCDSPASCDYPDFAIPAAKSVARGENEIGILLDGSGIGMSVAANKVKGVRAALAHDEFTARRAREHNHCNVLCLGTDLLAEEHIRNIVEIFIVTPFADGRHRARVEKIEQLEKPL